MWSDIWADVISDALEAIPDGVESDPHKSLTLYEWRDKGGYHVTGATKREFHLSCAATEFGGVIARDVEHLLDQAVQHKVVLQQALIAKSTPSETWLLVTLYYLAVYLGLAWLRLTGQAVAYIGSDEVGKLRKLGSINGNAKSPANGTFIIRCHEIIGARRILTLERCKHKNFHEAFWATLFEEFSGRLSHHRQAIAGPETRFFSCLAASGFADAAWPTRLRNLANYRVGFAYGGVIAEDSLKLVNAWPLSGFSELLDLVTVVEDLSLEVAHLPTFKVPSQYAKFLLHYTALLGIAVVQLRNDIWATRKISGKWQSRRDRYLEAWHGKSSNLSWSFS